MKAHKKLLEQLVIGARIARLNHPFGRVRIDISADEVNTLVKESKESRKKVEDLEQQIFALQLTAADNADVLESTHYCCRD